jgi:hypothetical protein
MIDVGFEMALAESLCRFPIARGRAACQVPKYREEIDHIQRSARYEYTKGVEKVN